MSCRDCLSALESPVPATTMERVRGGRHGKGSDAEHSRRDSKHITQGKTVGNGQHD